MTTLARPRPPVKPRPVHGTARLTLAINGTAYRVRPELCDPSAARKCYRLTKPDGTAYHVSEHSHGCECTCPDFVFRRDGIDPAGCKHVAALAACLMVPAREAAR